MATKLLLDSFMNELNIEGRIQELLAKHEPMLYTVAGCLVGVLVLATCLGSCFGHIMIVLLGKCCRVNKDVQHVHHIASTAATTVSPAGSVAGVGGGGGDKDSLFFLPAATTIRSSAATSTSAEELPPLLPLPSTDFLQP